MNWHWALPVAVSFPIHAGAHFFVLLANLVAMRWVTVWLRRQDLRPVRQHALRLRAVRRVAAFAVVTECTICLIVLAAESSHIVRPLCAVLSWVDVAAIAAGLIVLVNAVGCMLRAWVAGRGVSTEAAPLPQCAHCGYRQEQSSATPVCAECGNDPTTPNRAAVPKFPRVLAAAIVGLFAVAVVHLIVPLPYFAPQGASGVYAFPGPAQTQLTGHAWWYVMQTIDGRRPKFAQSHAPTFSISGRSDVDHIVLISIQGGVRNQLELLVGPERVALIEPGGIGAPVARTQAGVVSLLSPATAGWLSPQDVRSAAWGVLHFHENLRGMWAPSSDRADPTWHTCLACVIIALCGAGVGYHSACPSGLGRTRRSS